MIDLVIRNATRHDGSGAPPAHGDIGIDGGRIVAFDGPIAEGAGRAEVDVGGLAVAPGFIDLHTHSDVSLLSEPGCISAIEQGVTTQAVGLCGFSAGPVGPESLARLVEEEPVFAFPGVTWDWTTIGGYREAVEEARPATNVTTFVGHNSLRRFVVGSANRPPTDAELARMVDLIGEAIDEGARGFTTGLSYAPGLFAERGRADGARRCRRGARAAVPHPHALRTRRCGGVRPRGAPDGRAERGRAQHLAHVSARRPGTRGSGRAARAARRRPRPRDWTSPST